MKVAELLAQRQPHWAELERLCSLVESSSKRRPGAAGVSRFGSLYRAACADLAMADAYQLPPATVRYLHQLVAQAHNQLYPGRSFRVRHWARELLVHIPQRLLQDRCLWLSAALFYGLFFLSHVLARQSYEFTEAVLDVQGPGQAEALRESFSQRVQHEEGWVFATMAGYYVQHNASIGLQCFAAGLLFGIGGLYALAFNAIVLGASFGYISTTDAAENFYQFVTAHGPFELSAIVLCGAAGMRLGFSLVHTRGLSRAASLRQAGRETLPTACAAVVLFILAAMIEGFLSPSSMPYRFKALVAAVSSGLLMFYFVVLGWSSGSPRDADRPATWEAAASQSS